MIGMPSKGKRAKSKKTGSIPPGFHAITPYLTLSGAADAIEFYKKAFGAKELARETTPDGKVIHGRIRIDDSIIMMSDEFPGSVTKSPTSMGGTTGTLHIYSRNVDSLWERAVSAGATVVMPLDNQFWENVMGRLSIPSAIVGLFQ